MTASDAWHVAWLAVLWLGYFALHSVLAAQGVKVRVARLHPAWMRFYRLGYNAVATIALVPILWLLFHHPGPLVWAWNGPWAWLANGLALAAALGFVRSARYYDTGEFLGLRQWRSGTRDAADAEAFRISPFHRHVRHPWYAFGLVVLWTRDMSAAMLVSAVLTTVYLVVGAHLEEKKLVARFGDAYRRYQRRVPGLIPLPWKSISAEEAEDITALAARERTSPPPAR